MKPPISLNFWISILTIFVACLLVWGIFFIDKTGEKILVFGIVGAIITTISSVLSIVLNNRSTKERELELIRVREKQRVYAHFYNAFFEILKHVLDHEKPRKTSSAVEELMEFKKGLMNWGSDELIKSYLEFDERMQLPADPKDPYRLFRDGDRFLKDLRKDMGFVDNQDVKIMSVILDANARKKFEESSER